MLAAGVKAPDFDLADLRGGTVRLTTDGHPDTTFGVHGTGHIAFGSDSVPSFDYCHRLLTMFDGSVVFIGVRSGEGAFVAGLTSSGLADLRYGAGSGASELRLGSLRESADPRGDLSSSFVRTRDGDALLSWATADELLLAGSISMLATSATSHHRRHGRRRRRSPRQNPHRTRVPLRQRCLRQLAVVVAGGSAGSSCCCLARLR